MLAIPFRTRRSLPSALLAIIPVVCLVAAGCGSSETPGGTAKTGEPAVASQVAGTSAAASTKGIGQVDPDTLDPVDDVHSTALLLIAVWFGEVRLIDNLVITPA